ncbi:MAG: competence/damage-inducible protein A [Proteobacteria bacterium]|nr:competence/damage-inducible protein A [Pseudomonadota bacterium]
MTTPPPLRIALLSTGDELIFGDVINTNSQMLAQGLFDHAILPGTQATAGDNQFDIEQAIHFLLTDHQALIITGGLGPTSDDRTRFALSQVLATELIYDPTSWQRILDRLNKLSLPIPEINRQQCLFPRNAVIFPNDHGTAAACLVVHQQKPIFMLPGPPSECLPIFEKYVIPYLIEQGFQKSLYRQQWLLLGVSEGSIAAQLDPLVINTDCTVGYRTNWPYLEVKLYSLDQAALVSLQDKFEAIIGALSISHHRETASAQLKKWILQKSCHVAINDQATGGRLAALLLEPENYQYFHFNGNNQNYHQMTMTGLENYWSGKHEADNFELYMKLPNGKQLNKSFQFGYRRERVLAMAVETACWQFLLFISRL